MAKKKATIPGSPIGYGGSITVGEYQGPRVYDNNPDGPSNLPKFDLDGTRYPAGKKSFVNNVADGESQNRPDVNVVTADGVQSSTGKGKNCQYNWGDNKLDGRWNSNDDDWSGGNLTGM